MKSNKVLKEHLFLVGWPNIIRNKQFEEGLIIPAVDPFQAARKTLRLKPVTDKEIDHRGEAYCAPIWMIHSQILYKNYSEYKDLLNEGWEVYTIVQRTQKSSMSRVFAVKRYNYLKGLPE